MEIEERQRVIAIAREWFGTPWHHRARVRGAGVDCGQFIAAVYHEAGLIPEMTLEDYPPDWMLHRDEPRFQTTVERYARLTLAPPLPGDILLFKFGRSLSHGAIVEDLPVIIHSLAGQGVIRSNLEQEPELRRRLAGVWRFRGWP